MTKRIEKVTLKNFKGAAGTLELDFDKNKPIVLIFGENGTGKSTILDAIDFVCNQSLGSIMDRSFGRGSVPGKYMPTLGTSKDQLETSVKTSDGIWSGKIGARFQPSSTGPADNIPRVEILRRARILSIVNAEPNKRYEAIKEFVEVTVCEEAEKALRETEKTLQNKYDDSVKAVANSTESLQRLWEREGRTGTDAISWAKTMTARNLTELEVSLSDISSVDSALSSCTSASDSVVSAETLVAEADKGYKESIESYDKAKAQTAGDVDALIDVLREAKAYFEKNKSSVQCPVCEQPIIPDKLSARIAERLAAMNEQVSAKERVQQAKKTLDSKTTLLESKQRDFRTAAVNLKLKAEKSSSDIVKNAKINFDEYTELIDPKAKLSSTSFDQAKRLFSTIKPNADEFAAKKKELSSTKEKHTLIRTQLEILAENTESASQHKDTLERVRDILEVVEKQRKDFVEGLLKAIASEVERLYTLVHPDEGIGKITWYLNPSFHGSLEFEGQFQTASKVPPVAYYSESHLDTLGVCVFLALAKARATDNTVVLLDDVVTSVDQVHMERFFRMLNDEAEHFNQLIIATHYRQWRDRYRFYSDGSSKVQLIELQSWSLQKGIRHTKTKFSIEELREALNAAQFDRQLVASKAGVLLEGLFDRLARQFQCRLPLKTPSEYTLADYTSGFNTKLKQLLKVQKADGATFIEVSAFAQKLETSAQQTWVRNQVGCHFSLPGMDIADNDVKDFANRVIDLASALSCDHCGEFPSKNRSGSYWECRCGGARLFPLTSPGQAA